MAGSFCCELLMVWHGTHDWIYSAIYLLMSGHTMTDCALNIILVTPGWPLWTTFRLWGPNAIDMKNLPFQVMQEHSMVRCSLNCQYAFRTYRHFLHPSLGQPFIICCMRSWECGVLLGCLLDCFDLYSGHSWCKFKDGDIQSLNPNLLMWVDPAECICHRYHRTWNTINGENHRVEFSTVASVT